MALYSLYYLVNERKIQTESDLKYIFVVYKVNKNCDPVCSFFSPVFFKAYSALHCYLTIGDSLCQTECM